MEVNINLYSPRWGHEDSYVIRFDEKEINIMGVGAKEAKCVQNPNGSVGWSGHNQMTGNPLLNILQDDHIYAPDVFIDAIIHAWGSWKNGDLSDEQLDEEVAHLANWINTSTKNKPDSEFWSSYF